MPVGVHVPFPGTPPPPDTDTRLHCITCLPARTERAHMLQVAGTSALPVLDPPVTTNAYSDPRLAWSWGITTAYTVMFNQTTTSALDTTARSAYNLALASTPTR